MELVIQSGLVERRLIFGDMAKKKWGDYTWGVLALDNQWQLCGRAQRMLMIRMTTSQACLKQISCMNE